MEGNMQVRWIPTLSRFRGAGRPRYRAIRLPSTPIRKENEVTLAPTTLEVIVLIIDHRLWPSFVRCNSAGDNYVEFPRVYVLCHISLLCLPCGDYF